ncbi:eukaryotic translation initiation factor 4 gamma 1-like [Ruditapes philippinarum]|uniref:eukaryotic translation initiation factor 4 gamma 1-like n=1 Tax=Ruditapes philippinarum TaxID=129788 RepID=UPI00295BBDE1|nr:eukaryotic translation initiation factor 4 gamma 1-like [Ruditapes philippinarum]
MKLRGILNKMTPEKCQTLICRAKRLNIDTEPKLTEVVNLIFEKVIMEPTYSSVYTNMCHCMKIKVRSEQQEGKMVTFRALLLTRCQRFIRESRTELEKLKDADEATVSEYHSKLFGAYRFIGDLYNKGIVIENVIHDMIFKLLKWKDPVSLQCLCVIWPIVGEKLDVSKAKRRNDQYFQQMAKIAKDKRQPGNIKYRLLNVIDLRANNWISRLPVVKPKTLAAVRMDVEKEISGAELQNK